jgi:hypothetical protein
MAENKEKIIPINKYSIYELKGAVDTKIIEVIINLKIKFNKIVFRSKEF